jgi:hypothetical protein
MSTKVTMLIEDYETLIQYKQAFDNEYKYVWFCLSDLGHHQIRCIDGDEMKAILERKETECDDKIREIQERIQKLYDRNLIQRILNK